MSKNKNLLFEKLFAILYNPNPIFEISMVVFVS